MTQDEIIEMLAKVYGVAWTSKAQLRDLTAFANLVAQHEREACAEICKKHADVYASLKQSPLVRAVWAACIDNRDAIQARGNP